MERGAGGAGQGATLLVRHLPEALPQETLKRLFAHYGASDLRTCIAGRLKNCAFVDFADEVLAARAQSQLHRLRFLGKTLTVERARPHAVESNAGEEDGNKRKESKVPPPDEASLPSHSNYGAKPTSGSYGSEPIAAALGVDYPFPPHLEYAYPPPDGNILSNIVNALIAVPRFYTQVLHLMNKMNLPAPFRPALPAPPLPPIPRSTAQKRPADLSSDESELESSGEEDNAETITESKTRKRRRKEAILGPAAAVDASHEAAGVKTIVAAAKVLPSIKKKQPVMQIKIAPKAEEKLKSENENLEESKPEEVIEQRKVATREELEKGKLPPAEMAGHSVFKNYTPGNPSPVLYIKNLDKDVVPEDLCYVFGAFFSSFEEAQAGMSIKLMQEGRMKGQAFVRFPSVQIAGDALAGAHSFVLKGKPMVIQFGRNSAKS